jgi:hypothetical protein
MTMENKYRTWLPPWQEIVGFSEGAGRKKASGGKRENERLCPSESAVPPLHRTEHSLRPSRADQSKSEKGRVNRLAAPKGFQ